jgi:two-component system sensor histidine kinase RegB
MTDTIVQQALINLLNNASRAARSRVHVELQWDGSGGSVTIDDDGPGIPAEVIAQLGQPQAASQGLGIGLFLSHAALRRHGGQLQLMNPPTGGARAKVLLPAVATNGTDTA